MDHAILKDNVCQGKFHSFRHSGAQTMAHHCKNHKPKLAQYAPSVESPTSESAAPLVFFFSFCADFITFMAAAGCPGLLLDDEAQAGIAVGSLTMFFSVA